MSGRVACLRTPATVLASACALVLACRPEEDVSPAPPGVSGSGPLDGVMSSDGETGSGSGDLPGHGHNVAFVSSRTWVPGELGGLVEADLECQALADAAGLGGNYVAWLSSSSTDAKSRLAGARGWLRPDGLAFVDDVTDLINGATLYPLRLDENGHDTPDAVVLTATGADGTRIDGVDASTCDDWTSPDPMRSTSGGISDAGDELWTQWPALSLACSQPAHLYCFGVDADEPLQFEPASGRVAFLSVDEFVPALGLDVADAQCQQAAIEGGLDGQFVALLATDAASALARLDLAGEPWVRADGVRIVNDAEQLGTAIVAPIARDAAGVVTAPRLVWTGAPVLDELSPQESCVNWSSFAGQGRVGVSSRSTSAWYAEQLLECETDSAALYCLET